MAPSLLRFLPFTQGNSPIPSPISVRRNNTAWPRYGKSSVLADDSDEIPLKSTFDVSTNEYSKTSGRRSNLGSRRPKSSKYGIKGGWKGGARLAFYTSATVLFINVVLLIVFTTALPWMDSMTMVYIGSCTKTERINAGVHFVVNLLSTCLLAASNYCMQLLSAPTREDVDAAHATGKWLDIGIPSIRNLRSLKKKKVILWWILGISSMPLHLLYNSVFFSAIATNDYHVLYATPDFVTGAPYNETQFPDTADFKISEHQARASTFDRFDRQECIRAYAQDFITDRKDVILVVKNTTSTNSSLLKIVNDIMPPTGLTPADNPFAWICDDPRTVEKTDGCCNNTYGFIPCSSMTRELEAVADTWWRSGGFDIDYCLSETFPPDCHEHFAPPIMAPVLFFNIFKAAVIWYVAFRYKDKPLVTVGDAIESFIRNPDPTTKNMCLATHEQIEQNWSQGYIPQPQRYTPHSHRWYRSGTRRQWFLLSGLLGFATVGTSLAIGYGIENLNPSTIQNAWNMGMGTVRQQNVISGLKIAHLGSNALFVSALIANTPQAFFSFLYLVYNTVFTSMFLGREWDRFATHPKGRLLRVSEPVGEQKSTYILQIPYRYSIPMLFSSGILHWLVSQSIFLANISVIPLSGKVPNKDEITSCAYSIKGMIFVLVVGLVMIVWVVGNGMRSNSGFMVPAGSNSAAISAACHVIGRTGGERDAMVLRPLKWGVTDFGAAPRKNRNITSDNTTSNKSNYNNNNNNNNNNNITTTTLFATSATNTAVSTPTTTISATSPPPRSKYAIPQHSRQHSRQPSERDTYTDYIPSMSWQTMSMAEDTSYQGHAIGNGSFGTSQTTKPRETTQTPTRYRSPSPPPPPTPPKDHLLFDRAARTAAKPRDVINYSYPQRELDDAETAWSASIDQVGHCSFSDAAVGKPLEGRLYS